MKLLLLSTLGVAVIHALAPDHWVPFVAIAKAQNWSKRKLTLITLISGIGHIISSIVLGLLGIVFGFALAKIENFESSRGTIAGFILIGFGLAYAIWGLKQAKKNVQVKEAKLVTVWTLFAIFVLGPCEPLIPLMFLAMQYGWYGVGLISMVFGVATVFMMFILSFFTYSGLQLIPVEFLQKWTHAIAGVVIALTGVLVMLLGI